MPLFNPGDLLGHDIQPLNKCCALVLEVKMLTYKILWIRDVVSRLLYDRKIGYESREYIDARFYKIQ